MKARGHLSRLLALSVVCLATLQAEPTAPNPDQGSIGEGGKFSRPPQASGLRPNPTIGGKFTITEISPTQLKVGEITVDRQARTMSLPVEIAVRDQILEYLLVNDMGKTHESLLTTRVHPRDFHLAALLLNAVGQSATLRLSWRKNGPDAEYALAELVVPNDLQNGSWTYQPALYDSRGLVAQREHSFITLIKDPASLMTHSIAATLGKDDIYRPQQKLLPAEGVPLTLTISFAKD